MSGLDDFGHKAMSTVKRKWDAAPKGLKKWYIEVAQPAHSNEAEFFISEARFNASHITKGFTSQKEFTDDLQAIVLKPALLVLDGLMNGFMFTFKLLQVFIHLVVALVNLLFQPPKEAKTGISSVFGWINPFDKAQATQIPEADLNRAGNAAIDAAEALVKNIIYPWIATAEFGLQSFSFIAKCIFSLDETIEEKFNAAVTSAQNGIRGLMA